MANRRMYSKTITESDAFLDMSLSTQALYFHLGMQADDDGFVSPNRVIRMIGAQPDELKILLAKNFLIPFENGVVVIRHWKENNYIQNDRKKDTVYIKELAQLKEDCSGVYNLDTPCIQNVHVGKDRIGKESIVEGNSRFAPPTEDEVKNYCIERNNKVDVSKFVDFYTSKGWMVGKTKMKDWKACVRTWEKGASTERKDGNTMTLNDGTLAILRFGNWVDSSTNIKLDRNYYKELP